MLGMSEAKLKVSSKTCSQNHYWRVCCQYICHLRIQQPPTTHLTNYFPFAHDVGDNNDVDDVDVDDDDVVVDVVDVVDVDNRPKETLELAGQSVVEMMKPFSIKLMGKCLATALHYTVLHCIVLHCTALQCTALHSTSLYYTALHCTALHWS